MGGTGAAGRGGAVLRRWPTGVAVVSAAGLVTATRGEDAASALGSMLLLLPLVYLVVATLGRRRLTWPAVLAGTVLVVVGQALDLASTATLLTVAAPLLLGYDAVTGRLRRHDPVGPQAVGMLAFGAIALTALAVDPDAGRYLVAAGWFAHGVWDFVHLRRDAVVSRSYAEWCGVVDVLVALGLVLL